MRVLIGTPIHESKEYAVNKWLRAVSKLAYKDKELFLVDSSPSRDYIGHLIKIVPRGIKVSSIHVDVTSGGRYEQMAVSREFIRKKVLDEGFDWWFSWEEDLLIPPDSLKKMLAYSDQFSIIHHAHPSAYDPDMAHDSLGMSLIRRSVLAKFGFLLKTDRSDSTIPQAYKGVNRWFNRRVFESGGKQVKLYGVVKPIHFLTKKGQ